MNNARRLTEGAVLLAVFIILLLITAFIPFLGILSFWFLPLPFIYVAWKNEWKGILVFFVAAIFISLIVGPLLGLPFTLLFGTTGLTLGYLVQKNKNRVVILMSASMVYLINALLLYVTIVTLLKINFVSVLNEAIQQSYNDSIQKLIAAGQSNNAEQFKDQMDLMIKQIKALLPSFLVIGSFVIVYLLQLINFSILKRFGMILPHWKSFRELALPKSIIWYYLITVVLSITLTPEDGSYIQYALWNLLYILQILLAVQGLSFIFYFSFIKGLPKTIPIIATVLLLGGPVVLEIYRILGIIDLGFEFRKRLVKK